MAKGVGREDVFEAADALVMEGLRPTIERVRQKMGRGSPNTVSPLLDEWFQTLGPRLQAPSAPLSSLGAAPGSLPRATAEGQVPAEPLETAMRQLWAGVSAHVEQALVQAQSQHEEALALLKRQLAQTQEALSQAQAREQTSLLEAEQARAQALQSRQAALSAETLSQTLAEELRQERKTRVQAEASAQAERQALMAQAANAERHWLLEVERARQGTKATEKKIQEQQKAYQQALAEVQASAASQACAATEREAQLRAELGRLLQLVVTPAPARAGASPSKDMVVKGATRWPKGPGLRRRARS